jgi:hypothetical protein
VARHFRCGILIPVAIYIIVACIVTIIRVQSATAGRFAFLAHPSQSILQRDKKTPVSGRAALLSAVLACASQHAPAWIDKAVTWTTVWMLLQKVSFSGILLFPERHLNANAHEHTPFLCVHIWNIYGSEVPLTPLLALHTQEEK